MFLNMSFQDLKPSNIAVNEDCEVKVIYGPFPSVTVLYLVLWVAIGNMGANHKSNGTVITQRANTTVRLFCRFYSVLPKFRPKILKNKTLGHPSTAWN